MQDIVTRFMSLFAGLDRAYGTYEINDSKYDGNKLIGKAVTTRKPVTESLWEHHLQGQLGIGIIPITDDSTCNFGAIDVDTYPLDLGEFARKIKDLNLPLVPVRSKSGGCHAYLFMAEPVQASLVRKKLQEFAAALGCGSSEIFPKQDAVLAARGDLGSWINMPYFESDNTSRYGVKPDGSPMTLMEFLVYAENARQTAKDLNKIAIRSADLKDGPPCLQHLLAYGFPQGTRNDGLFNVGVYLRKSNPDGWRTEIHEYNDQFMQPPLSTSEVEGVIKSVERKDYAYTCSRSPIKPHCNAGACRLRKHGVGNNGMPSLGGLTKYDTNPPIWFIDVDGGGRMDMLTEDLQSQHRFQRRCMSALNFMPPMMNNNAWQQMIQTLLDNVTVIEASADSSPEGQMFELLERFCTGKAQAKAKDEILLGKPFTEDGRHYFRMSDFLSYLERQHFREFRVNKITSLIKEHDGQHHFALIKGKGVNHWSIPAFAQQSDGHDVPQIEDKEHY